MKTSAETMGETVQIDFTLAVGPGRLDASVCVPTANVTLTQILPAIQNLTNHTVDLVVESLVEQGRQVSCRAGCGACCRQLVPLSIFEAEALAGWITSLPAEQQTELERRFHDALVTLSEKDVLDRMSPETWVKGNEVAKDLAVDYLAAGVACPFLQNESCGIHPVRPLICREYLVTSSPRFCASPSEHQVDGVVMPLHPSRALFLLGSELEGGGPGWIPLTFLMAWMKSGARPGDAVSGSGPEVLYQFVSALSR